MPRKRKTSADSEVIKEYQRNWLRNKLKNDPEYKVKHYESKQKRASTNRLNLKQLKESSSCLACGNYYPSVCMDYHHLNPDQKERRVSSMLESHSWKSIEKEIEKCILLCANCHRKIHSDLFMLV